MVDLLTPKELAVVWRVPLSEIYPLLVVGIVPAFKIQNRWFIPAGILEKVKSLG